MKTLGSVVIRLRLYRTIEIMSARAKSTIIIIY